jgi:hypothetical protein
MIRDEDERIEGDVNNRLSTELPDDSAQIQVNVTHGEVTLAGTVDTSEAWRRAEDRREPRRLRIEMRPHGRGEDLGHGRSHLRLQGWRGREASGGAQVPSTENMLSTARSAVQQTHGTANYASCGGVRMDIARQSPRRPGLAFDGKSETLWPVGPPLDRPAATSEVTRGNHC